MSQVSMYSYVEIRSMQSKTLKVVRKWYDGNALMCRVSYLLRHLCASVLVLRRKCLSTRHFWLTTQGVTIISAAYAQSIQSIIKALYNLLTYKSLLKASSSCIRQPLIISEPL